MVQITVQIKGPGIEKIISETVENVSELKREVLNGTADTIANFSVDAIDSGFYAARHQVSSGSISGAQTKQKPSGAKTIRRDGSPQITGAQDVGRSKMKGQISSMSMDSNVFYFSNQMVYAPLVETKHGYAVYARTVRELPSIIQEVVQRIKARNR